MSRSSRHGRMRALPGTGPWFSCHFASACRRTSSCRRMALRSSGVRESLHQRPFLQLARHARCSTGLMNFRMRPISVLPELAERELRVPNGQGVKKVAVQKVQLGAFRADAAAKRETAAPSDHAPDTRLAGERNTEPHTTTSVDGDGTSACSESRSCSRRQGRILAPFGTGP